MTLDKAMVKEKMLQWESVLGAYSLPDWEAFPALPLYMDQVIFLLNQYLSLLPGEAGERLVTPAMINNYVKLKIIPPPIKKRYGRSHLAYLVMVCLLKQTINTGEIRKLLPLELEEQEVRAIYSEFTASYHSMKGYFSQEVRRAAEPIFSEENEPVTQLIFASSAAASLSQLLTEQLLLLYPQDWKETEKK